MTTDEMRFRARLAVLHTADAVVDGFTWLILAVLLRRPHLHSW